MQNELIYMTKSIDFYFDVISPYSYIAYKRIKNDYSDNKIKFSLKPILLGGLHKLAGITAPAFNEFKMLNMKNDCELVAKKNNIDFQWNTNFPINSINIMRGYILIEDQFKEKYLNSFFDAYWKDNRNLSKSENFLNILDNLGLDKANILDEIQNENIKDQLKKLTNEAFNKKVFGAPTFIVNNKIFWGQDRLEYAIEEFVN